MDPWVREARIVVEGVRLDLNPSPQNVQETVKLLEEKCSTLARAAFVLGRRDTSSVGDDVLCKSINYLASIELRSGFLYTEWRRLRKFAASALYYAASLGALVSGRYSLLKRLWEVTIDPDNSRPRAVSLLSSGEVLPEQMLQMLPKFERRRFPGSEWMEAFLQRSIGDLMPSTEPLQGAFDKFEYLSAIAGYSLQAGYYIGAFAYRYNFRHQSMDLGGAPPVLPDGQLHPLLKLGMFSGKPESMEQAIHKVREQSLNATLPHA